MTDLKRMTDLKPDTEGGAHILSATPSGLSPANIQPAQPTSAKTAPTKPDPAVTQPVPLHRPHTAPAGLTANPRMTACTKPSCTGTILDDDYCDVCGNPVNAAAPVPVQVAAAVPTKPAQPQGPAEVG